MSIKDQILNCPELTISASGAITLAIVNYWDANKKCFINNETFDNMTEDLKGKEKAEMVKYKNTLWPILSQTACNLVDMAWKTKRPDGRMDDNIYLGTNAQLAWARSELIYNPPKGITEYEITMPEPDAVCLLWPEYMHDLKKAMEKQSDELHD